MPDGGICTEYFFDKYIIPGLSGVFDWQAREISICAVTVYLCLGIRSTDVEWSSVYSGYRHASGILDFPYNPPYDSMSLRCQTILLSWLHLTSILRHGTECTWDILNTPYETIIPSQTKIYPCSWDLLGPAIQITVSIHYCRLPAAAQPKAFSKPGNRQLPDVSWHCQLHRNTWSNTRNNTTD